MITNSICINKIDRDLNAILYSLIFVVIKDLSLNYIRDFIYTSFTICIIIDPIVKTVSIKQLFSIIVQLSFNRWTLSDIIAFAYITTKFLNIIEFNIIIMNSKYSYLQIKTNTLRVTILIIVSFINYTDAQNFCPDANTVSDGREFLK